RAKDVANKDHDRLTLRHLSCIASKSRNNVSARITRAVISNSFLFTTKRKRICCPNTSADAICDELVCKRTIYDMKKGMILSAALSVVGLMLVSCSSEPEATTTTTRQTTVTTAAPPPPAARTTTTTTHTGGGY